MDQCFNVTGETNFPELLKQKDEVQKTFHEKMEDLHSTANERF